MKVNLVSENGKTSIGCASWVELHGGAQLCLDTTNTLTGAVYFEAADGAPYIRVCQGSRLELIAGANSQVASPFAGRLIVEDTSSARIVSYDSCVPESYDGITDSLTLVPIPLENSSYSDQWKVKEGAKSGKYAFTLSQTITEVPNRLSKCEVLIQGSQCENDGVAGLPATGDHARIGLWLTLMVMSGAGMILVRRRVHS